MTPNHLAYYYLWVAPHVLQAVLLAVLVRRKLYRQFPMFVVYIGFEVLQCAVLVWLSQLRPHFGPLYSQAYSLGLALSTAIRFGVIYELFRYFFRRYPALSGLGSVLFRGATVLLLLIAVALAVSAPGRAAEQSSHLMAYFSLRATTIALDRAVTMLQCGLLVTLFLFSRYFVLSWRSHAFGIALGLGVFAAVELATAAMHLYFLSSGKIFDYANMVTYHLCVLIWMFYLMARERAPKEPKFRAKKLPDYDLDVWNRELQRLIQQ